MLQSNKIYYFKARDGRIYYEEIYSLSDLEKSLKLSVKRLKDLKAYNSNDNNCN